MALQNMIRIDLISCIIIDQNDSMPSPYIEGQRDKNIRVCASKEKHKCDSPWLVDEIIAHLKIILTAVL